MGITHKYHSVRVKYRLKVSYNGGRFLWQVSYERFWFFMKVTQMAQYFSSNTEKGCDTLRSFTMQILTLAFQKKVYIYVSI